MEEESLKKKFTKRFSVAIAIIALLSTVSFGLLYEMLSCSESMSLFSSISNKQRLLSSRITSLSQEYYLNLVMPSSPPKNSTLLGLHIEGYANEMLINHQSLFSNHHPSNAISLFYNGKEGVSQQMNAFLSLSKQLIAPNLTTQERGSILDALVLRSTSLLELLQDVETQHQIESKEKLIFIKNLAICLWCITLATLLLEIIFIFQPMSRILKNYFLQASSQQQELGQQIKIRTINLEKVNEKLNHLASHDPLTGLKNRLHMEETLKQTMLHYQVNALPYAVAMFDIDWFKNINDTYGHDAGDFVLEEIAFILNNATRPQDAIFRSGGEEFVIIFHHIKPDDAINRCELIRVRVEQHLFVYKNIEFNLTISGGIFHPETQEAQTLTDVLKFADNALYSAKSKGRNRIILGKDL